MPSAEATTIRVLLVDDHPVVCAGVRALLECEPDIKVIGEAGTGEEAYTLYREQQPDVVLMDLSMPGFGGLEAIRRMAGRDEKARILVFSIHESEVMLARALEAGAMGFVTKGSSPELLPIAVRRVAAGHRTFSPDLACRRTRAHAKNGRTVLDDLSAREFEVFCLLARGYAVNETAELLSLSPKTVSNHLTNIKRKLQPSGGANLTLIAIQHGIIEP